jgi:hypothetical protein
MLHLLKYCFFFDLCLFLVVGNSYEYFHLHRFRVSLVVGLIVEGPANLNLQH